MKMTPDALHQLLDSVAAPVLRRHALRHGIPVSETGVELVDERIRHRVIAQIVRAEFGK